jgi:hypothetical protein
MMKFILDGLVRETIDSAQLSTIAGAVSHQVDSPEDRTDRITSTQHGMAFATPRTFPLQIPVKIGILST